MTPREYAEAELRRVDHIISAEDHKVDRTELRMLLERAYEQGAAAEKPLAPMPTWLKTAIDNLSTDDVLEFALFLDRPDHCAAIHKAIGESFTPSVCEHQFEHNPDAASLLYDACVLCGELKDFVNPQPPCQHEWRSVPQCYKEFCELCGVNR